MHARHAVAALLVAVSPMLFAATPEQWRRDLAYFARELPKRHANAFHAVSRETFDATVRELDSRTETASDAEMVVGLMRLTALVGDGHTNVHIPKEWNRLAIQIQTFGDEWRVTRVTPATKAILGAKVTAIGGMAIADVVQRLAPLSPQDELPPLQRATLVANMHIVEVLRGVGVNPAEITAVADDGTSSTVPVAAIPLAAQMQQQWVPLSAETPPLSRRDPQSAFVIQNVSERKAVYVNWRRYDNLSDNAAKLWQLVDSVGATTVVIDLRQNGGGDFKVGRRYMVSEAAKRAAKVKTIVLIGARTFSAAMVNAIDFRNEAHALLAGDTIGEKPNSYSENDEMTLPASRLVLSYSTRYYKFVPDDAPNVVEPDQRVEQTWADAKAGRDAALDWALSRK
ncbi:MAG: hypothetical protein AABO58_05130 [Acidobacteriota bacterium]